MEETTYARRLGEAVRTIQTAHLVMAALAVAGLAVLRVAGVLHEWWVLALPLLQHQALGLIIGAYFGRRVVPQVIEERNQGA